MNTGRSVLTDANAPSPLPHCRSGDGPIRNSSWAWVNKMTDDEVEWLERLPFTYTLRGLRPTPGGRLAAAAAAADPIVVHAGLVPGVPLEQQKPQDMSMVRNLEVVENARGEEDTRYSALERDSKVCKRRGG